MMCVFLSWLELRRADAEQHGFRFARILREQLAPFVFEVILFVFWIASRTNQRQAALKIVAQVLQFKLVSVNIRAGEFGLGLGCRGRRRWRNADDGE